MFGFVKRMFVSAMMRFGCNLTSTKPLECISTNNQAWKVRTGIANVNNEGPVFYHFIIKASKCSCTYNNINDPYAKFCVLDVIENINIKVFNIISKSIETRHIKWQKTFKCKCRLDASVCNNKQR